MIDGDQSPDESIVDPLQIAQGQIALIQLAIHEDAIDHTLDEAFDAL
jgi:hypothetical protein